MDNTSIVVGIIIFCLGVSMIYLILKYRIMDSAKQYKVVLLVIIVLLLLMLGVYIISCGIELKAINEKLKNPEFLDVGTLRELLALKDMYIRHSVIAIIVGIVTCIFSISFIKYESKKLNRDTSKELWDLKKISDQLSRKD